MRGAERADVLFVLQVLGNKADAVPCECLPKIQFMHGAFPAKSLPGPDGRVRNRL